MLNRSCIHLILHRLFMRNDTSTITVSHPGMISIDALKEKSLSSVNCSSRFGISTALIAIRITNAPDLLSLWGENSFALYIRQVAFLLCEQTRDFESWGIDPDGPVFIRIAHMRSHSEILPLTKRLLTLSKAVHVHNSNGAIIPKFRALARRCKTLTPYRLPFCTYSNRLTIQLTPSRMT